MLNKVILIGRLTRDPELRYTPNGNAVCQFSLAVNRKFKKDEADFIDIVTWRGLAENCAQYLGKGSLAAVEGRIQIRSYENQEGQKRRVTEVIADDVRFLGGKTSSNPSRASSGSSQPKDDNWEDLGKEISLDDIDLVDGDEEIPF
ncbi:Single-stranded DNA-binding protein [Candidatus Syntrophocurvum alkaliphilum]|uniref:Single-stranded DNA-binding protein n=1 Tax=Candidatus Syntrophocurvum alkaliphilum TaxID=2293317 RepID=A0A6I6DDR3_9FIRM|nr:single-stranded DNA-binding protein [Candidatus Syntrophocurvum alkaliphilum]QGU00642.1 Single-stranded DNA-binding protein [Candidatus Syntrophocurvum alkaliphilum]